MKESLLKIVLFLAVGTIAVTGNANQPLEQGSMVSAATAQSALNTPSVATTQDGDKTILVSPRTGMRYVLNNPSRVPVIFKTEVLAPVNAQNVGRIVATNPALSQQSQEQAKLELMKLANIAPAL